MSEPRSDAVDADAPGAAEERAAAPALEVAGGDPVEALRRQLGRAVVDHPGVLRLEPTLVGSIRGLRRRSSLDGIALVASGRVVDLDVNLSTRADRQARASVIELQGQLRELVERHGFVPGSVEISVLAVGETPV